MKENNPRAPMPEWFTEWLGNKKSLNGSEGGIVENSHGWEIALAVYRHLSPSAAPAAGMRYTIPVKICNSCGGPVSNDPFERVIHEEGGYEYYFCQKCCDQNKHFKITPPPPPTPGA